MDEKLPKEEEDLELELELEELFDDEEEDEDPELLASTGTNALPSASATTAARMCRTEVFIVFLSK